MNSKLTQYLGFCAVTITACSAYLTADTYSTVLRFQAEALASYYAALDAFNNWQTAVKPICDAWVTASASTVTSGISEVKAAGTGTAVSWVMFVVSVWMKRKTGGTNESA